MTRHTHPAPTLPALLTLDEAAQYLRVSRRMVQKLVETGAIRYVMVSEKVRRFKVADLEEFLEARTTRGGSCPSTSRRNRRTGTTISSGKVLAFTAQRAN